MAEYDNAIALAERLLLKKGRLITLASVSTTPADSAEPWRGADRVATPDTTITVRAAFVPPNTVRQFGLTSLGLGSEIMGTTEMYEQVAIASNNDRDFRPYSYVIDTDTSEWKIIGLQQLRPGAQFVLSFIGLRR